MSFRYQAVSGHTQTKEGTNDHDEQVTNVTTTRARTIPKERAIEVMFICSLVPVVDDTLKSRTEASRCNTNSTDLRTDQALRFSIHVTSCGFGYRNSLVAYLVPVTSFQPEINIAKDFDVGARVLGMFSRHVRIRYRSVVHSFISSVSEQLTPAVPTNKKSKSSFVFPCCFLVGRFGDWRAREHMTINNSRLSSSMLR